MTNLRTISLSVLSCALLFSAVLAGPVAVKAQSAAPAVRIVTPIDEGQLVTLKGNTLASANAKNDRGIVSPDLRMTDLILVLSRSPQQQAAFDAYVAGEYDQNSPNYHQWLTPQQIGAQFGPAPADVATISGWLASQGFTVDAVTPDNMTIRFSGNAGQVQSAFHTEIHNLIVNGKPHIANMSDPQIPAALATVVVGVKALHNFFPRPLHRMGGTVTRDSETGKWQRIASRATGSSTLTQLGPAAKALATAKPTAASPQFGISGTYSGGGTYLVEDVDPWDFATIYNILPLWNAGTPIDGTGQTIAIAGTSDIDVGQSSSTETGANGNNDVATFRNYFGLPTGNAVNTPIRISGNSQPLTVCTDTTGTVPYVDNPCGIDDLTENSLDVEWSGSVAKNAQIVLVSSYPASVTDDNLYDSESYIVNHLTARIMNVSYGECELSNGTAGNVEYYDLWQQAAAEGISVFVAAGDSGSASCDDGNLFAESGLTVSGLASTPYDTAVGGTDFNWCNPDTAFGTGTTPCAAAPYWSSTAITSQGSTQPVTTALGYVPETPWNESCANPLTLKWSQDLANFMGSVYGGFSGSNITNPEQACNFIADFYFYDTPGYYGYEYGLLYYDPYYADLLQVVGGSGGASNCVVGTATTNTETGEITGCTTGATSTGNTTNPDTGASQASLTLVNNGWPKPSWQTGVTGIPSDGVRDIPDVSFFAADGFISSSAYLICVSQADPSHACTYSTYSEPVYQEVGGTSVATPAMAGVMALINQKTGVSQGLAAPELYTLAHNQTYSSCSAESVTTSSSCMFNDIDAGPSSSVPYTNAQPCDAGIYGNGVTTPNCLANQTTLGYADAGEGLGISTGYSAGTGYDLATGLGSLNVANVVNHWVSVIGSGATTVTVSPSPNPVSLGASVSVTVTVGSNPSGSTTPTGSVTLYGGGYTSSAETLVSGGTDSTGSYTFTIPAGALAGGTDTLTADYSGDANYASSTGSNTVTVNKNNATVSATPSPTSIESNQQVVITGTVTCSGTCTGAATPTGTVTVSYGTSYTSQAATLVSGQYSVTITPNSIPGGTPSQNDALTVNYSGDDNYNAASTTTSVAVTFFQVQTPTLTITPTSTTVDSGSPLLVTVSVSCVMPPATACPTTPGGTVTLTGGGFAAAAPASMQLTNGTAQFPIPANTLNSNPLAPTTDTLTANYLGDADYAQVQTSINLTVTQSAYTVSATSPGSSVTPGSTATSSVSVATTTDYTGTVTFSNASCVLTGYPSGVTSATLGNPTCALTGSGAVTVTDGSPSGPVTFTVSTTSTTSPLAALSLPKFGGMNLGGDAQASAAILAKATRPSAPRSNGAGWFETAGGAALAALFLFFVPGGARKWRQMLGVVLVMFAISFAVAGCGGGSSGGATTPTLVTPTVTVTPSVTSVAINGSAFTVSVNVTGTAGTATGGVTLTGPGYTNPAGTGTLASGNTSFTINPSSFTSDGTVTLTAAYSGNSAYNPASGTATISVSNVPTTPGTYTFTVKPTASSPSLTVQPSTTFTVDVN